jgi:uncharacterized oxidoreductase
MTIQNNTVLITGGSAGIGFEIAKLLAAKGNKVIITGRNAARLNEAAAKIPNATAVVSDVSQDEDVKLLVATIHKQFPGLNVVINNAGSAFLYNLIDDTNVFDMAREEMLTNYLSVIRLNEALLPILRKQPQSAIVNVSSVVALVPGSLATYSASKAALHSYTQSLRIALADTPVQVFELMPPLVNTTFSAPIGGDKGMAASAVAEALITALENNEEEIHVGQTKDLYELFLSSPAKALDFMQGSRKAVAV